MKFLPKGPRYAARLDQARREHQDRPVTLNPAPTLKPQAHPRQSEIDAYRAIPSLFK